MDAGQEGGGCLEGEEGEEGMTYKKLVFLIAVAAGSAAKQVRDGRGDVTASVVGYAFRIPDENIPEDIGEAADEYISYSFQTDSLGKRITEPTWAKKKKKKS